MMTPSGWSVSKAVVKKTNSKCAVFVYKKSKNQFNSFFDALGKECRQLIQLRHPAILRVVEPLMDSKDFMAFASEPLNANLALVLPSINGSLVADDGLLDETDIQAGLMQIIKALQFLHSNSILHLCLAPESIFIDPNGEWKLGGFAYSQKIGSSGSSSPDSLPYSVMPRMCYFAPELLTNSFPIDRAADVFSLASLIFSIFNKGKGFTSTSSINTYVDEMKNSNISLTVTSNVPAPLVPKLKEMVSFDPQFRPNLDNLLLSDYFTNSLLDTLQGVKSMLEKTPVEKAQLLKALLTKLQQFSFRTVTQKILPYLVQELKNAEIAPFALPCIFWVSERLEPKEFCELILPDLEKEIYPERDPPHALLLLLSRIDILISKIQDDKKVVSSVGGLIVQCLYSRNLQIILASCKNLPRVTERLDQSFLTLKICPHLIKVFSTCKSIQAQVLCLIGLKSIIKKLNQSSVIDNIYTPLLDRLPHPVPEDFIQVLIEIHQMASSVFDYSNNTIKTIPSLWQLVSHPGLTSAQYNILKESIQQISHQSFQAREKAGFATVSKSDLKKDLEKPVPSPHDSTVLVPNQVRNQTTTTPTFHSTSAFLNRIDDSLKTPFIKPLKAPPSYTAPNTNANTNSKDSLKQDWAEFDPL